MLMLLQRGGHQVGLDNMGRQRQISGPPVIAVPDRHDDHAFTAQVQGKKLAAPAERLAVIGFQSRRRAADSDHGL